MAEKYSIIQIYYVVFIFSYVDRHLGSFYFVPIINNVAKNIYVQVFEETCIFISVRYIPRGGIADLNDNSIFNLLMKC